MNTSEIILFVLFVLLVSISKTSLVTTEDKDINLIHDNTKSLHIAMNKLFLILKLNKTFKQAPRIQLLLNMHNNFINIIENNHKINEKLGNITDNIPIKDWFHINEAMSKISFKKIIRRNASSGNKSNMSYLKNRISKVIVEYMVDFLVKIENLKVNVMDTFIPSHNLIDEENTYVTRPMKSMRNSSPDLKIWIPENNDTDITLQRRMFKSKRTKVKKYPFMVSVHVMAEFVCAGSIIRKDLVITAASCLQMIYNSRNNAKSLSHVMVRVGSDFTTYGGQLIAITNVYFHPSYDWMTLKNNIAILRMDTQLRFNKKRKIRRILIDRTGELLRNQEAFIMLGWGARDEGNTPFEFQKLSYANLDLYTLDDCKEVFSTVYVSNTNFCGGFTSKGGGACNRDVGDPAIIAARLVGVVSFGPPLCGTPDAPTVFTRISLYTSWIDNIADENTGLTTTPRWHDPYIQKGTTSTMRWHDPYYKQPVGVAAALRMAISPATTKQHKYYTMDPLRLRHPELNYPEEVKILREILHDLAMSNTTVLADLIDEGFKKEFKHAIETTTHMNIAHHPLKDKSIVLIPGIHIPTEPTTQYVKVKLTTANDSISNVKLKEDYIDYEEFAYVFQAFQNNFAHKRPELMDFTEPTLITTSRGPDSTITMSTRFTDADIAIERTFKKNTTYAPSDDYSENYEDSDTSKGLSIEYTTATVSEKPYISEDKDGYVHDKIKNDGDSYFEGLSIQETSAEYHENTMSSRQPRLTKLTKNYDSQRFQNKRFEDLKTTYKKSLASRQFTTYKYKENTRQKYTIKYKRPERWDYSNKFNYDKEPRNSETTKYNWDKGDNWETKNNENDRNNWDYKNSRDNKNSQDKKNNWDIKNNWDNNNNRDNKNNLDNKNYWDNENNWDNANNWDNKNNWDSETNWNKNNWENKDNWDTKSSRETTNNWNNKNNWDEKNNWNNKNNWDIKSSRETTNNWNNKNNWDEKNNWNNKNNWDTKSSRETTNNWHNKNNWDEKNNWNNKNNWDTKSSRETTNNWHNKNNWDEKNNWNNKNNWDEQNNWNSKNNWDTKSSRDNRNNWDNKNNWDEKNNRDNKNNWDNKNSRDNKHNLDSKNNWDNINKRDHDSLQSKRTSRQAKTYPSDIEKSKSPRDNIPYNSRHQDDRSYYEKSANKHKDRDNRAKKIRKGEDKQKHIKKPRKIFLTGAISDDEFDYSKGKDIFE